MTPTNESILDWCRENRPKNFRIYQFSYTPDYYKWNCSVKSNNKIIRLQPVLARTLEEARRKVSKWLNRRKIFVQEIIVRR